MMPVLVFQFAGHRIGCHRFHADRRHEFRHLVSCGQWALPPALFARSGSRLVHRCLPGQHFCRRLYIWKDGIYPDLDTALRHSAFNVVSIATTTGYASVDYALWPIFAPLWMLFLSSFATSAGSTGGGIKMMRALLLYKQVYRELLRAMHPNAVYNVRIGGQVAPQPILFAVLAFGFMYMVSIVTLTLVLSLPGSISSRRSPPLLPASITPAQDSGVVGPSTTYEVLEDFQTWVCIFAMLLGRLEIFTLLVVLTPAFWRK
jgi:trk system potassium uptake protein TrkH